MLGFPQGPFVLVLQPDDPDAFSSFLRNSGSDVPVRIRYASSGDGTSGEWAIVPVHGHDDLIVRFGIPPLLDSWLLAAGEAELERARLAKKTLFSTIAVFHHGNRMTRLRYEKAERREPADQVLSDAVPALRRELAAPELAFRGRKERFRGDDHDPWPSHLPGWTRAGLTELLNRLDQEGYFQADVIRTAVMQEGQVSRQQVYEIGNLDPDRTLRGFQQPINRITRQLRQEGIIAEGAGPVLRTFHGHDGRATHFEIPADVRQLLDGN
jgi:hypothetical protein